MSDERADLILEHLRAIHSDIAEIKDENSRPLAKSEVSSPYREEHVELAIHYHYDSTDRPMPDGDPTIFGLPCRFPAAAPMRPECRV